MIFTDGGGKGVRSACIYPACRMAYGERFALAPVMVFYFCTELQIISFMDRFKIHISRNFLEHILYAWFVYHCRGLHKLADLNVVMPFYVVVSNGASFPFDFVRAHKHLRNFRNFTITHQSITRIGSLRKRM